MRPDGKRLTALTVSCGLGLAFLLFTAGCGKSEPDSSQRSNQIAPSGTDRTVDARPSKTRKPKTRKRPAVHWKAAADLVALAAAGKGTAKCAPPLRGTRGLKSHMVWPCVYLAPPAPAADRPRASSMPFTTPGCITVGTFTRSVDLFARPSAKPKTSSTMLGYLKKNYVPGVYDHRKALHLKAGCRSVFRIDLDPGPARLSFATVAMWGHAHTQPAELEVRVNDGEGGARTLLKSTLTRDSRLWKPVQLTLPKGNARSGRRTVRLEFRVAGQPDRSVHVAVANPMVHTRKRSTPPDNVVMILVDTLRADVVGALGAKHNATPNIDRLALRGVSFTQAITAATWTRPSIMALLTAIFPHRYEPITRRFTPSEPMKWAFYRKRPHLLPVLMAKAGHTTFYVGNNFFMGHAPRSGLDHGFMVTQDIRHHILDSPAITRRAVQIMEEMKSSPFFLFLHYDSPHNPHVFPPAFTKQIRPAGRWARDRHMRTYLATVAYADAQVGQLMAALRRLKLNKRTLVFLFSDHGELIFRWHVGRDEIRRRFSHGWILYEEVARVPLFVVRPGKVPAGLKVEKVVRTVDIPATVMDHLGLRWPRPVDGRSLNLYWKTCDTTEPLRLGLLQSRGGYMLRKERFKYILFRAPIPKRSPRPVGEMIFDLKKDPEERSNLAGTDPALLARMRQELRTLLSSQPANR